MSNKMIEKCAQDLIGPVALTLTTITFTHPRGERLCVHLIQGSSHLTVIRVLMAVSDDCTPLGLFFPNI